MFDNPYKYCNADRAKTDIFTDANRVEARKIAADCFVLLKNQNSVLPLKRPERLLLLVHWQITKRICRAHGAWLPILIKATSLLTGLKAVAGDKAKFVYAKGSNLDYDAAFEERATMFGKSLARDNRPASEILNEALTVAKDADVIVAALGEAAEMTGEASSRSDIQIPESQRDLLKALVKTGKPVVLVLFTGRPLAIKWENDNVPAILNVWFGGSEAGYAIADVLFGDVNPSGKLTTTWPQNVGQVPIYYSHKSTGRPLPEGQWFQKNSAAIIWM